MPRFTARLGVFAVSALLCGTAQAATPEAQSTAATLSQSVDTGVRDAQAKRLQKDYTGAVRVLSQLMLIAPDDSRVVGEYGKTLIQQGRAREALDFLQRAIQLQQGDWTIYSALGVAYDQSGDYASARGAYDRALTLQPGETIVLNNYAMSRALAGDLVQAKSLIAQASAGSKDERIARNVKLINGLKPAGNALPAMATVSKAAVATTAPRAINQSGTVMMQAIPADPNAGTMKPKSRKAKATATATAAPAAKKADPNGIPALRLANDRP